MTYPMTDTFRFIFEKIHIEILALTKSVSDDGRKSLTEIKSHLGTLEELVKDLIILKGKHVSDIALVNESDLPEDGWSILGQGNFGVVFRIRYQGNDSAIKIFTDEASSKFRETSAEINVLRGLGHDNIIAFRGTGYVRSERLASLGVGLEREGATPVVRFIIMEYIERTLDTYVERSKTPVQHGLSPVDAWTIGRKIANGLHYLHDKDIAHRDLKPDNILYDPGSRVLKIADFGLAWHNEFVNTKYLFGSQTTSSGPSGTRSRRHVRWGPPEFYNMGMVTDVPAPDRYKRGDIWCYGMILAYMITGQKPFTRLQTADIDPSEQEGTGAQIVRLPNNLQPELRDIVDSCRQVKPEDRPSAQRLLGKYDKAMKDRFLMTPQEKEFFSCAFMEKTDIFVADSCISEYTHGYFATGIRPVGYQRQFLLCPVETAHAPYNPKPPSDMWDFGDVYYEKYADLKNFKEITNNPFIALKGLTIARPGAEEIQKLELRFVESTYYHHRAMREIWIKELTPEARHVEVPCKAIVHPYYSTSFGLQVAILTNEGEGSPQKYIFCRRARTAAIPMPGSLTCGAVESCSINDYVGEEEGKVKLVSLVKTAARGLSEELGLELTGSDLDAIVLHTIYLKFEFHEWAMCGFVDLRDERIKPEHRISAKNLEARFLGGAKDKFEHDGMIAVDFKLDTMVDFIYQKHHELAGSAKLVVVKVLQAFFGVDTVQRQLELRGGKE